MGVARCQDAGIYRCAFSYMAVRGGVYVMPSSKLEDAVLDGMATLQDINWAPVPHILKKNKNKNIYIVHRVV